jgi:putative membrane protein insertion efficiency factor
MRRLAHYLIRFYQLTFSSLLGRQCRYEPSCSHYMDEAIGAYGLWAGGWMGVARLCRCHPWGSSGYDPIPAQCEGVWYRPWRYGKWRLTPAQAQERIRKCEG